MTWNISILSVTGPFGCQNISVISLGSLLASSMYIYFPYIIMPGVRSSSSSFTYSSLRVTLLPPFFLSFLLFPLLPPSFLSILLYSFISFLRRSSPSACSPLLLPSFLSFFLHSSPSSFILLLLPSLLSFIPLLPPVPPFVLPFFFHSFLLLVIPQCHAYPLLRPNFPHTFFIHSFLSQNTPSFRKTLFPSIKHYFL